MTGYANLIHTRATEYSKAATRGDWNSVWDGVNRRVKAKAIGEARVAANEGNEADGVDMFAAAWVAGE